MRCLWQRVGSDPLHKVSALRGDGASGLIQWVSGRRKMMLQASKSYKEERRGRARHRDKSQEHTRSQRPRSNHQERATHTDASRGKPQPSGRKAARSAVAEKSGRKEAEPTPQEPPPPVRGPPPRPRAAQPQTPPLAPKHFAQLQKRAREQSRARSHSASSMAPGSPAAAQARPRSAPLLHHESRSAEHHEAPQHHKVGAQSKVPAGHGRAKSRAMRQLRAMQVVKRIL